LLVAGNFEKIGTEVRLTVRVIDTDTAEERTSFHADGAYKDIFKLQADLARQIIAKARGVLRETGILRSDALPAKSVDAFHAFSDGVYFLRNDFPKDALEQFDRAQALDPDYVQAQFYRGRA